MRPVAYNEELAGRVRTALADSTDVEEKRMFGGLSLMVAGQTCSVCSRATEAGVEMEAGRVNSASVRYGRRRVRHRPSDRKNRPASRFSDSF